MPYHEKVAQALADTIVPRGGPFELGAADLPIAQRLESMTVRLGYPFRPVRLFLIFLDWLPVLLFFKLSRFTRLAPQEREAFVAGLANSRWLIHQALFYAIKALVVATFYADPQGGAAIGYPGDASWSFPSPSPLPPAGEGVRRTGEGWNTGKLEPDADG